MSLLSDIRGEPSTLYALLKLLSAAGGHLSLDELRGWLQPGLDKPSGSLVDGATGVARSLGFVTVEGRDYHLALEPLPESIRDLSNPVHSRIASSPKDDPDHVVLQVFAWFVVKCDQEQGTDWINHYSRNELLADDIDRALRVTLGETDTSHFNKDKIAAWDRWVTYVGLASPLPGTRFYPYIYPRLKQVIRQATGSRIVLDSKIPYQEIESLISTEMPYLDGGSIHSEMSRALNFSPKPKSIGWLLSFALRELHDREEIYLEALGDAKDTYALARDAFSKFNNLKNVIVKEAILK